ncbi:MAG: hypothetical protein MZV49_23435 [Rhodopseudomonas palustris]|nr:hypothetical protein [Rhodopseudomonas palustris]
MLTVAAGDNVVRAAAAADHRARRKSPRPWSGWSARAPSLSSAPRPPRSGAAV